MTSPFSAFAARLREFMAQSACLDSKAGTSHFGTWALDLFALQFEHNAAYRQLCGDRAEPAMVRDWRSIPAAPAAAFKELELTSVPPAARVAVFHSSGTTQQKPGRHFHDAESLAVYKASLLPWFTRHLLADASEKLRFLFLTPAPSQAPRSSLAYMFETVRRTCATPESAFVGNIVADGAWSLDLARLLATLHECQARNKPVAVLGTAFNFVDLLDALEENNLRFNLPSGSRVMETGGYKGRSRALPKAELHGLISHRLGVPPDRIVCEYGMSELSSQAYDKSVRPAENQTRRHGNFRFPPWARGLVISPETGRPAPAGEPGLLRVFDLANLASVMAVQTEDLAIQHGDGFELLGRAALAEPRGCSRMSA